MPLISNLHSNVDAHGEDENSQVERVLSQTRQRLAIGCGVAFAAAWIVLYGFVLVGTAGRWIPVILGLLAIVVLHHRGSISIWVASAALGCLASFLAGPLPAHMQWLLIVRNMSLAVAIPALCNVIPRSLVWARKKNWLQFRIATLLACFVLVGLVSLYWRNNLRPRHAREELIQLVSSFGGKVRSTSSKVRVAEGLFADAKMLADRDLDFTSTRITDAQLARLARHAGVAAVRSIHLRNSPITDRGARELGRFTNVHYLMLDRSLITDDGMRELSKMPQLHGLTVNSPYLTDECFAHLRSVPWLRQLTISGRSITQGAVGRFRDARPSCTVNDMTYKQQLQWEAQQ